MTYAIHEHETIQVVQVNSLFNELDNQAILEEVKNRIHQGCNDLVVDLSELDFMNSVGLNFLISMMNTSKSAGSSLAVANANEQVIMLLEVTKLKKMFTLTQTVEEALNIIEKNN